MNSGIEQAGRRGRAPRLAAVAALALLALCLPGAASAQWTQPDAQGNTSTTGAGNVGIGTATPENSEGWNKVLDVYGTQHSKFSLRTSNIDGRVLSHDLGWWGAPAGMVVGTRTAHPLSFGTGGAARMIITGTGNIGIGTMAPAERLDVRGNMILEAGGNPTLFTGTGAGELNRYFHLINAPGHTSASGLKVGGVLISDDYAFAYPAKNDLVVKGNVGIGMASPAYKLDVAGAIHSTSGGFVFPDGTTQTTAATPGAATAAGISAGQFGQNSGGGNFSFPSNVLMNTTVAALIDTGASNRFRVCGPNGQCLLAGEYIGGRLRLSADGSFANAEAQVDPGMGGINAPGNAFVGGNVGIGTATPENSEGWNRVLDVSGSQHAKFSLRTANIDGRVLSHDLGWWGAPAGMVVGTRTAHPLSFGTAGVSRMTIEQSGKVGIGTTAPATALHVVGDVTVTGNISAKYQDVAEWVPSAQKLAAGMVVILDPERPNHVLASAASYDTAVAGVISEKPGLALGEAGEGKALVATTGRVKVRVDATRAPIKIGDLLVTSDAAGVAMKSEPVVVGGRRMHAPGTIIGKALEPLAGGTGEILVLLSLQ